MRPYNSVSNSLSSSRPSQSPEPASLWRRCVSLLNQDIVLIPRQARRSIATESSGETADKGKPVASLLDPGKLAIFSFRRLLLDWRDTSHVELCQTLEAIHDAFTHHIDAELKNLSLKRRLVSQPAVEVLGTGFSQHIASPLIACLQHQETALQACLERCDVNASAPWSFDTRQLPADCSFLGDLKFKPSQRDQIRAQVQIFLFGPSGLQKRFSEQATGVVQRLMKDHLSC